MNPPKESQPCISDQTWFDYYSKLNTENYIPSPSENDLLHDLEERNEYNIALDYPVSITEIKHHVKKLKNNKSPGPDLICNEMLKHVPPYKSFLTCYFLVVSIHLTGKRVL